MFPPVSKPRALCPAEQPMITSVTPRLQWNLSSTRLTPQCRYCTRGVDTDNQPHDIKTGRRQRNLNTIQISCHQISIGEKSHLKAREEVRGILSLDGFTFLKTYYVSTHGSCLTDLAGINSPILQLDSKRCWFGHNIVRITMLAGVRGR